MCRLFSITLALALCLSLVSCGTQKADKYCTNCGNGMAQSDLFCAECGTEVNGSIKTSSINDTTTTESERSSSTVAKTTSKNTKTTTKKQTVTTTKQQITTTTIPTTVIPPVNTYDLLKQWIQTYGTVSSEEFVYSHYNGTDKIYHSISYNASFDTIYLAMVLFNESGGLSITTTLILPKVLSGNYQWTCSVEYNGVITERANGIIDSASFTPEYPISCQYYVGDESERENTLSFAKTGVNLSLLWFYDELEKSNSQITFTNLGLPAYDKSII